MLIEEKIVLAASIFLAKRETIPHESAILDEEEKAVLSSGSSLAI